MKHYIYHKNIYILTYTLQTTTGCILVLILHILSESIFTPFYLGLASHRMFEGKSRIVLERPLTASHQGQSHLPPEENPVLWESLWLVSLPPELGQLTSLLEVVLLFP